MYILKIKRWIQWQHHVLINPMATAPQFICMAAKGDFGESYLCSIITSSTWQQLTSINVGRKRNVNFKEEWQFCRNFFTILQIISQTTICGQWCFRNKLLNIITHMGQVGVMRLARSLKTKWGIIKHNVANLQGIFLQVLAWRSL